MQTCRVTGYGSVHAVLADPRFVVPPAPGGGVAGGIGWLRATVARFSNGADHQRRRALAAAELARVDPAGLRRRAFDRSAAVLSAAGARPIELMAEVARVVPVELLGDALGIPATAGDVATVAQAYHPHVAAGPDTDRAVARLVEACGGVADEPTAARIGLLVQACDATAGLIGNAVLAALRQGPPGPAAAGWGKPASGKADVAEAVVAETLRHDPPVLSTRRLATAAARVNGTYLAAGTLVELDLTANRDPSAAAAPGGIGPDYADLAFGAGAHACPGRAHALAIAAGVVEAVRGHVLADPDVGYAPANLRVPTALVVRAALVVQAR
jgi:cytochrome P450